MKVKLPIFPAIFSRAEFSSAVCSISLLIALVALPNSNAHALPFNDDLVNNQLKTGQIMRSKPVGSVPRGSLADRYETKEEVQALVNPVKADASSLARGERLYKVNCTPCHGDTSKTPWQPGASGAKMGAPNLTQQMYRERSDGSIFGTIHFGGMAIMPAYGWKLSTRDHWDVINYVRKLQAQ